METIKKEASLLEPNSNWTDSEKNIYTICANYFALCLKCTKDPEMNEKFKNPKYTVAFLTNGLLGDGEKVWKTSNGEAWDGCGMVLPKNTRVLLDYDVAWPTLYITNKDNNNTITIRESPLSVFATSSDPKENETFRELLTKSGDVKLELPISKENLSNYDATLIMPCFMPDKDMLTKVSCIDDNDNEIILTSC